MKIFFSLIIFLGVCFASTLEEATEEHLKGNYKEAVKIWEKLADEGNVEAMLKLGNNYSILHRDERKRWLNFAAFKGNPEAIYSLSLYEDNFDKSRELKKEAERIWKKLANEGNVEAMLKLGTIYGLNLNNNEKKKWLNLAADQRNPKAIYSLAELEDNEDKKKKWLNLAADQGDPEAMYLLTINEENKDKKLELLKASAKKGYESAYSSLGSIYENGYDAVKKDYKESFKWYKLSAEQGNERSMVSVSEHYENGWGVKKDLKEAYKWIMLFDENSPNEGSPVAAFCDRHPSTCK